jgi:hypothetical protein
MTVNKFSSSRVQGGVVQILLPTHGYKYVYFCPKFEKKKIRGNPRALEQIGLEILEFLGSVFSFGYIYFLKTQQYKLLTHF